MNVKRPQALVCLGSLVSALVTAQVAPRIVTVFDHASFKPSSNRHLVDVTGDGRADLVWRHGPKINVRVAASGGGYLPASVWGSWPTAWEMKFGDVNGDGKADLVGRQADAMAGLGTWISVSLSSGSAFVSSSAWTYWSTSADYHLGDFNHDGKADLIGRAGSFLHVALSTGGGFAPSSPWTYWSPAASYKVGDFNGDGYADLIGRVGSNLEVALSNGSGFLPSQPWTYWNPAAEYDPADFDGDGASDIIGMLGSDVHVARSTRSSFQASSVWTTVAANDELLIGDLNADHRADLVIRRVNTSNGTVNVMISASNGSQFQAPALWIQASDPTIALMGRIDMARLQTTVTEFTTRFRRRGIGCTGCTSHSEGYANNLEAAENYLLSKLRGWGYFAFSEAVYDVKCGGYCGRNVVALRPGFTATSQFLDVTAHYDGGYHNDDTYGAKDNATGVASVLEIAYAMRDVATEHAIRYVFFTAEEVAQDAPGSLGFLRSPNGAKDRVVAALNYDLTGTPDTQLYLWYRGRASFEIGQLMAKQNATYSLGFGFLGVDASNEPEDQFRVQSDERSYAVEGLTAVTSLGGTWKTNAHHHTSLDTPANVNYFNAYRIAQINLATLLALELSNRL